jgi:hypothetical protein
MSEAYGNPWDVAVSTTFRSLSGDSVRHLDNSYSARSFSDGFRARVGLLSEGVRNTSIYRNAIGALRKLRHSREDNSIRRLRGIGQLQHAPRCMERYLVANPVIRQGYNNRMMAGYEDGYSKSDKWRGTAYKHTDKSWQMVMQGRTDEEELMCHTYALTDSEANELSNSEAIDVIVTWKEQIRVMNETDDDVVSTYNALRG